MEKTHQIVKICVQDGLGILKVDIQQRLLIGRFYTTANKLDEMSLDNGNCGNCSAREMKSSAESSGQAYGTTSHNEISANVSMF